MSTATDFCDAPFHCPADMLFQAYKRLGSVWKVGDEFGIKGSTVHARLRRAGLMEPRGPEFTVSQIERIKEYYVATAAADFDLAALASELGKSRQNISRTARRLGLSKRGRSPSDAARAKTTAPRWHNKPHPRGMAGKKHKPEVIQAMSVRSRLNWATWKAFGIGRMSKENRDAASIISSLRQANRPASNNYTRTKGGHRDDLGGIYFRSSWEANYARYLNMLIRFKVVQSWEFEPETFWFEGIRRGSVSYKPDFKIYYRGDTRPEYVEIKGWEVEKDRTKWRRMKKYYPEIKLVIIGAKEYRALAAKWSSSIPNWETQKSAARAKAAG